MTELAYALDYLNAAQTYLASYLDNGRLSSLVRATESTRRGTRCYCRSNHSPSPSHTHTHPKRATR